MARFAEGDHDGPMIEVPAGRRHESPAQRKVRMQRNLLWLWATERGLPDPLTGKTRLYTTFELAKLWGAGRQTIYDGIHIAKAVLLLKSRIADED